MCFLIQTVLTGLSSPGVPGLPWHPPDISRSVNPISTRVAPPDFQTFLRPCLLVPFKLLPLLMAGIFALIVFATSTSKCLGKSDLINIFPFIAPSISVLVLVSTWFFLTLLGCSLYIFHFFHGSFLLPYLSSYLNKIYNIV